MRVEHVALPTCPECGRQWLPDNKEPWRADLGRWRARWACGDRLLLPGL